MPGTPVDQTTANSSSGISSEESRPTRSRAVEIREELSTAGPSVFVSGAYITVQRRLPEGVGATTYDVAAEAEKAVRERIRKLLSE